MTQFRIPLAKPEITGADRQAVLDVLHTSNLSFGPKLTEFENAIAVYLQVKHAVAVNSGTSALQLAFQLLNLPAGSEVILPSFAFAAPLNILLHENFHPVFVDIDPATLNTTPELVEAAITPKTKAIIAIHTFGHPIDASKLREIADRRGIFLIEDACEALGSELDGRKTGSFGHISVLAFYPNKQTPQAREAFLQQINSNGPSTRADCAIRDVILHSIGISKRRSVLATAFPK